MAKAMSDTVREALLTALRDGLESDGDTQPKKRRGRGTATKLVVGAALAAAAAPVAKRGASAVRDSDEGPLAELDDTAAALVDQAAQRVSDVHHLVQVWIATQKLKRGAIDPEEAAEAGVDAAKPEEHRERLERFERQAKASGSRKRSSSKSASSSKAGTSKPAKPRSRSKSSSASKSLSSRKSNSRAKKSGSTRSSGRRSTSGRN